MQVETLLSTGHISLHPHLFKTKILRPLPRFDAVVYFVALYCLAKETPQKRYIVVENLVLVKVDLREVHRSLAMIISFIAVTLWVCFKTFNLLVMALCTVLFLVAASLRYEDAANVRNWFYYTKIGLPFVAKIDGIVTNKNNAHITLTLATATIIALITMLFRFHAHKHANFTEAESEFRERNTGRMHIDLYCQQTKEALQRCLSSSSQIDRGTLVNFRDHLADHKTLALITDRTEAKSLWAVIPLLDALISMIDAKATAGRIAAQTQVVHDAIPEFKYHSRLS